MTEAELQRAVVDLATMYGYLTYHTHDSRRSNPGFPDLVLVHPRRRAPVLFLELKTEKGRVTPAQGAWIVALGNASEDIVARVVRPDDLDEVARLLGPRP